MTVSRKVGVWGVTWGSAVVLSAGALFPPDPCRASLRIVNASGRVVETVSLTFTADPPGAADPPGVITADPPGEHRAGQATGLMNPGTLVGFNPQPDPPGLPAKR